MSDATERYLKTLAKQLPRSQRRRVIAEIRFHIREAIRNEQANGATAEAAEQLVLERLGSAAELAAQFAGDEHPAPTRRRVLAALIALRAATIGVARKRLARSAQPGSTLSHSSRHERQAGNRFRAAAESLRLALRRVRTRPLPAVATGCALAVAAGLVGWTSVSVAAAQERNVRLRLTALPADERALRVTYYTVAGSRDMHAAEVASVVHGLSALTRGVYRVTVWHPIAPPEAQGGTSFVVPSNLAADTIVQAGHLPQGGCTPKRCEALALSGGLRVGQLLTLPPQQIATGNGGKTIHYGGARVEIVGVGKMNPAVMPSGDKLGSRQLVVRSLDDRTLQQQAMSEAGSTTVTTAPLAPDTIQAPALGATIARLNRVVTGLVASDPEGLVQASAPTSVLSALEQRGAVARDRLLLISGQIAALVIAFAAFAAAVRRGEVLLAEQQLLDLGASRSQTRIVQALEVLIPGLLAAIAVYGGLYAAAAAATPAGVATSGFVSWALPASTLITVGTVLVVAIALIIAAERRPAPRRFGVGPLEAAASVALAVVVWQAISSNDLDANRLASGSHNPVLLLLPALAFFVSAVVLVRVLPLLMRVAERAARRAPIGIRLALLGAARRPGQAAAATTFLAVAVGVAAFSLNYRATLVDQAREQANFAAGAAWRVIENDPPRPNPVDSSTDVAPLTRYAAASGERPTPVIRVGVEQTDIYLGGGQTTAPMTLLGIPASTLTQIRGWRNSFASTYRLRASRVALAPSSRRELAQALAPNPVSIGGPRLAGDASRLRVWAKGSAYPTNVVAWFLLPGQVTRSVLLSPRPVPPSPAKALSVGWRLLSYRIPPALHGAQLIGVDLDPVTQQFGPVGFMGRVWLGPFQQRLPSGWSTMNTLSGWTPIPDQFDRPGQLRRVTLKHGPVRQALLYNRNGTVVPYLRRSDDLPSAIPALASPAVAAWAFDRDVSFAYAGEPPVTVRIVGVARLFPTVDSSRFIVLDYNAAFDVLNRTLPGSVPPSEAWFFRPQRAGFAAAVAEPPFRLQRLVSAQQNQQALVADPLAGGTQNVLLASAAVAALLGFLGLLIAVRGTLRDEHAILGEYEALGVRPSVLTRSTAVRLAALSVIGIAAGIAGGIAAVGFVGALVAVTASGGIPVPPIQTVVTWPGMLVVVAVVGASTIGTALVLARQAVRAPTGERLRL